MNSTSFFFIVCIIFLLHSFLTLFVFNFVPIISLFFKDFINFFKGRGGEGEREREKHQCPSPMSPAGDLAHNTGTCSTGNQSGNPLVHRPTLNPLSYTSHGIYIFFILYIFYFFYFNFISNLIFYSSLVLLHFVFILLLFLF